VAAWLSETVLRGRGPGAIVGSIPPKGEDFFEIRNLRRAMDVCVDGRVVEGRATLFRHHREVSMVRIPGWMGLPWMLYVHSRFTHSVGTARVGTFEVSSARFF
jgi:hypothetical protein